MTSEVGHEMSSDELRRMVERIAELSRDNARIMLEASQQMGRIEKDRDRRLKPNVEELDPLVQKVWDYIDAHPELFATGSTVKFPDAILSRKPSTRHEIPDQDMLVKVLRQLGEGDVVKITESVAVADLKAREGLIDRLRRAAEDVVRVLPMWNYRLSFLPKNTVSEKGGLPKELKHDSPAKDVD